MWKLALAASLALAAPAQAADAMTDAGLAALVDQRLAGDRTGACMAVAVVERDHVTRAYRCADPADASRIGADTAFEIGSVSKTMTSVLLADLILRDAASLDDPLADHLPAGTNVPSFGDAPILLRHVVTHTSGLPGLPSRMGTPDPANPYAKLDEDMLLASLGDVTLSAAPGTAFEYSNFASMLLSYAVSRRAEADLESLMRQRLFAPLGMDRAYINDPPPGVRAATGHTPNRQTTPAWTFATNLAGVGGVRATLDDMVRYVQGNLGQLDTPIALAFELAQRRVGEQPPMAMNWMLLPVDGRVVHMHEGGTGGFSSFVSVDRERGRGVVILSDTTWNSIGSLGSLGLHLVDPGFPLGKPRRQVPPPEDLLQALAGDYQLQGAMKMTLRARDGRLFAQAEGQAEIELAYDDGGDFYPLGLDAVLRPQRKAGGGYGFTWMQMGGAFGATRLDASEQAAPPPALSEEELQAYAGEYPLMPGFVLHVRAHDGRLHARATGQGEFALDAAGPDLFEAAAFGIEIVFTRDAAGKVVSLALHQGGQVLEGDRQ